MIAEGHDLFADEGLVPGVVAGETGEPVHEVGLGVILARAQMFNHAGSCGGIRWAGGEDQVVGAHVRGEG